MFLVKFFTVITNLFAAKSLDPSYIDSGGGFSGLFMWLGGAFTWLFQWIVKVVLYNLSRFLMAFMDFLQYFIQKLIGLDYWLNTDHYTMSGALKADLLFSFIFDDTVQKTFKALVGLFVVLLIIFTIFAIIRSEWQYIAGGKGQFGDGSNSKSSIIRSALKAITLVIIFPLVMIMGIMSSNAILASLVKALNIDTGSTFGAAMFSVASQSANKYKNYASSSRSPVTDNIEFYIGNSETENIISGTSGKYIFLNSALHNDNLSYGVNDYQTFLALTNKADKYSVNTMFDPFQCEYGQFEGYCVRFDLDDTSYWYLVQLGDNKAEDMRYYLKNVLGLPLMTKNDSIGNAKLLSAIKSTGSISNKGLISADFHKESNGSEIAKAVWNVWGYAEIYSRTFDFDQTVFYTTLKQNKDLNKNTYLLKSYNNDSQFSKYDSKDDPSLIKVLGFSELDNVKVMFNSNTMSPYFDQGQLGLVNLQTEYLVMADLVDFMAQNDVTVYMMNANSTMIDWDYSGYSASATQWVGNLTVKNGSTHSGHKLYSNNTKNYEALFTDNSIISNKIPLVVSYSDTASDLDSGNNLYLADLDATSEVDGAVYLMCYKVVEGTTTKYVPILNGKSFTDTVSGETFNFKSKYYTSNYNGVIIAKGIMDTGNDSSERSLGMPTYIENSVYDKSGNKISSNKYYYEMIDVGSIKPYVGYGVNTNSSTNNTSTKDFYNVSVDATEFEKLEGSVGLELTNVYTYSGSNKLEAVKNTETGKFEFLTNDKLVLSSVSSKYHSSYYASMVKDNDNNDTNTFKFNKSDITISSVELKNADDFGTGWSFKQDNKDWYFKPIDSRTYTLNNFTITIKIGNKERIISESNRVRNNIFYVIDENGNYVYFTLKIYNVDGFAEWVNEEHLWKIEVSNDFDLNTSDVNFQVKIKDNNQTFTPISLGGDYYAVKIDNKWYFFTLIESDNTYSITNELPGDNILGKDKLTIEADVYSYTKDKNKKITLDESSKENVVLKYYGNDKNYVCEYNGNYYHCEIDNTTKGSISCSSVDTENGIKVITAKQELEIIYSSDKKYFYFTQAKGNGTNVVYSSSQTEEWLTGSFSNNLIKMTIDKQEDKKDEERSYTFISYTGNELLIDNNEKVFEYKYDTNYFFLKLNGSKVYLAQAETWSLSFEEKAFGGSYYAIDKGLKDFISYGSTTKDVSISLSGSGSNSSMYFDESNVSTSEESKYEFSSTSSDDLYYYVVKHKQTDSTSETGDLKDDDKFTLTSDFMKYLVINIPYSKGGNNYTFTAKCVNNSEITSVNGDNYLFSFTAEDGKIYYFVVSVFTTNNQKNTFMIKSYSDGGNLVNQTSATVTAVANEYCVYYSYLDPKKPTTVGNIAIEDFSYSKTLSNGYRLFTTNDRQYIQATKKYDYLSVVFDTSTSNPYQLINFSESRIDFAKPMTSEKGGYSSAFYAFFLYDYYHGVAGTNYGTIYKYDVATGGSSEVTRKNITTQAGLDALADDNNVIFCFIDGGDFSWDTQSGSYGLYNGKQYVATIYKNKGTSIDTNNLANNLRTKTIELFHDNKTYYNIQSQNSYESQEALNIYYKNIVGDSFIKFNRCNYKGSFIKIDFGISLIFGGTYFRFHAKLSVLNMDRNSSFGTTIKINKGINYDYFFADDIDLTTFYVPSKIMYLVIFLGAMIIIKTLATAIWGVVKRFYEITLYYLAMPAVASTIPLDEGQNFQRAIQKPLIEKVLSTYGVILGINVFFVLLTPVKSLSQVFTDEDIATSGMYFLTHLMKFIDADLLNGIVYIIFMLVAFTMIDTLPGVVTQIVTGNSNEDLLKKGADTKNSAKKIAMDRLNAVSGKTAVDKFTGAVDFAKGTIPGKVIGAIHRHNKEKKDNFNKGLDNGGKSGGDGGSGGDTTQTENVSSKVDGVTGDGDNTTDNTQTENETEGEVKSKIDEIVNPNADTSAGDVAGAPIENAATGSVAENLNDTVQSIDDASEESIQDQYNASGEKGEDLSSVVGGAEGSVEGAQAATANTVKAMAESKGEEGSSTVANIVGSIASGKTGDEKTATAESINQVINNGKTENGTEGEVSTDAKLAAIMSAEDPNGKAEIEEKLKDENGNALTGDALEKAKQDIVSGYQFNAKTDKNGNVTGLSVAKLDENGKAGKQMQVKDDTAVKAVAESAKSTVNSETHQKKVDEAINGKKGLMSAVSNQSKIDAIRSTMSKEERDKFDKQFEGKEGKDLESAQKKALKNYQVTGSVNQDTGEFELAVSKLDDKGNVTETKAVTDKSVVKEVSKDILNSDKVTNEDISNAVNDSADKVKADVQKTAGNNLILAAGSGLTGTMDERIVNFISGSKASENADAAKVNGEAVLATLQSTDQGRVILSNVLKEMNSTTEDLNDPEKRTAIIAALHDKKQNNDDPTSAFSVYMKGHNQEYSKLVLDKAKESAMNGGLSVSKWDIADEKDREKIVENAQKKANEANPSILQNATEEEKQQIIGNTVNNILADDSVKGTDFAKNIENRILQDSVSEEELESLTPEQIQALSGNKNASKLEDLDKNDIARIGFMKKKFGLEKLSDFNAEDEGNQQKLKEYRLEFDDADERAKVIRENFTNTEIAQAVSRSKVMTNIIDGMASRDASLALTEEEKTAIDATLDPNATKEQRQQAYKDRLNANKVVRNELDTDEELHAASVEDSKTMLESNDDSLMVAYAKAGFKLEGDTDGSLKQAKIDDAVLAFTGIDTEEKADAELQKLVDSKKFTPEQVEKLKQKGMDSKQIMLNYNKALLSGEIDSTTTGQELMLGMLEMSEHGANYNEQVINRISEIALSGDATDEDIENYNRAREILVGKGSITIEDKQKLVENVSKNGVLALTEEQKQQYIAEEIIDRTPAALNAIKREEYLKRNSNATSEDELESAKANADFVAAFEATGVKIADASPEKVKEFYEEYKKNSSNQKVVNAIKQDSNVRHLLKEKGYTDSQISKMSKFESDTILDSMVAKDAEINELFNSEDPEKKKEVAGIIDNFLSRPENKKYSEMVEDLLSNVTYEQVSDHFKFAEIDIDDTNKDLSTEINNEVRQNSKVVEDIKQSKVEKAKAGVKVETSDVIDLATEDADFIAAFEEASKKKLGDNITTKNDIEAFINSDAGKDFRDAYKKGGVSAVVGDKKFVKAFENSTKKKFKSGLTSKEDITAFLDSDEGKSFKDKYVEQKKDEATKDIQNEEITDDDINLYLKEHENVKRSMQTRIRAKKTTVEGVKKDVASNEEVVDILNVTDAEATNDVKEELAKENKAIEKVEHIKLSEDNSAVLKVAKTNSLFVSYMRRNNSKVDLENISDEDLQKYYDTFKDSNKEDAKQIEDKASKLQRISAVQGISIDELTQKSTKEIDELDEKTSKIEYIASQTKDGVTIENLQKIAQIQNIDETFSETVKNDTSINIDENDKNKVSSDDIVSRLKKSGKVSEEKINETKKTVAKNKRDQAIVKAELNSNTKAGKEVEVYTELEREEYDKFLKENNLEDNNDSKSKFYIAQRLANKDKFEETAKQATEYVDQEENVESFITAMSLKDKKRFKKFKDTHGLANDKLAKLKFYQSEKLGNNDMLTEAGKLAAVKKGQILGKEIESFASLNSEEFEKFAQSKENEGLDTDLLKVRFYEEAQKKAEMEPNNRKERKEKEKAIESLSQARTLAEIKSGKTKLGAQISRFVGEEDVKKDYEKFSEKYKKTHGENVDEAEIKLAFYNKNKSKFDNKVKNNKLDVSQTMSYDEAREEEFNKRNKRTMGSLIGGLKTAKYVNADEMNVSDGEIEGLLDGELGDIVTELDENGRKIDSEGNKRYRSQKLLGKNADAKFITFAKMDGNKQENLDEVVRAYAGITSENASNLMASQVGELSTRQRNSLVEAGFTNPEQIMVAFNKLKLAGTIDENSSTNDKVRAILKLKDNEENANVTETALEQMSVKALDKNASDEDKRNYAAAKNAVEELLVSDESGVTLADVEAAGSMGATALNKEQTDKLYTELAKSDSVKDSSGKTVVDVVAEEKKKKALKSEEGRKDFANLLRNNEKFKNAVGDIDNLSDEQLISKYNALEKSNSDVASQIAKEYVKDNDISEFIGNKRSKKAAEFRGKLYDAASQKTYEDISEMISIDNGENSEKSNNEKSMKKVVADTNAQFTAYTKGDMSKKTVDKAILTYAGISTAKEAEDRVNKLVEEGKISKKEFKKLHETKSYEEILVGYEKAKLTGDIKGKKGENVFKAISSSIDDAEKDKLALQNMQKNAINGKDVDAYAKARDVIIGSLSEEDKAELISKTSKNGELALNDDKRNELTVSLAKENQDVYNAAKRHKMLEGVKLEESELIDAISNNEDARKAYDAENGKGSFEKALKKGKNKDILKFYDKFKENDANKSVVDDIEFKAKAQKVLSKDSELVYAISNNEEARKAYNAKNGEGSFEKALKEGKNKDILNFYNNDFKKDNKSAFDDIESKFRAQYSLGEDINVNALSDERLNNELDSLVVKKESENKEAFKIDDNDIINTLNNSRNSGLRETIDRNISGLTYTEISDRLTVKDGEKAENYKSKPMTEEEKQAESDKIATEIKNKEEKRKKSLEAAAMNDNIQFVEYSNSNMVKHDDVNNIVKAYSNITTNKESAVALREIKNLSEKDIAKLEKENTSSDILVAYEKAKLLGMVDNKTNSKGIAKAINAVMNDESVDSKVLQAMYEKGTSDNASNEEKLAFVNAKSVMNNTLTKEQKIELVKSAATSGINSLSAKEQDDLKVKLAMEDEDVVAQAKRDKLVNGTKVHTSDLSNAALETTEFNKFLKEKGYDSEFDDINYYYKQFAAQNKGSDLINSIEYNAKLRKVVGNNVDTMSEARINEQLDKQVEKKGIKVDNDKQSILNTINLSRNANLVADVNKKANSMSYEEINEKLGGLNSSKNNYQVGENVELTQDDINNILVDEIKNGKDESGAEILKEANRETLVSTIKDENIAAVAKNNKAFRKAYAIYNNIEFEDVEKASDEDIAKFYNERYKVDENVNEGNSKNVDKIEYAAIAKQNEEIIKNKETYNTLINNEKFKAQFNAEKGENAIDSASEEDVINFYNDNNNIYNSKNDISYLKVFKESKEFRTAYEKKYGKNSFSKDYNIKNKDNILNFFKNDFKKNPEFNNLKVALKNKIDIKKEYANIDKDINSNVNDVMTNSNDKNLDKLISYTGTTADDKTILSVLNSENNVDYKENLERKIKNDNIAKTTTQKVNVTEGSTNEILDTIKAEEESAKQSETAFVEGEDSNGEKNYISSEEAVRRIKENPYLLKKAKQEIARRKGIILVDNSGTASDEEITSRARQDESIMRGIAEEDYNKELEQAKAHNKMVDDYNDNHDTFTGLVIDSVSNAEGLKLRSSKDYKNEYAKELRKTGVKDDDINSLLSGEKSIYEIEGYTKKQENLMMSYNVDNSRETLRNNVLNKLNGKVSDEQANELAERFIRNGNEIDLQKYLDEKDRNELRQDYNNYSKSSSDFVTKQNVELQYLKNDLGTLKDSEKYIDKDSISKMSDEQREILKSAYGEEKFNEIANREAVDTSKKFDIATMEKSKEKVINKKINKMSDERVNSYLNENAEIKTILAENIINDKKKAANEEFSKFAASNEEVTNDVLNNQDENSDLVEKIKRQRISNTEVQSKVIDNVKKDDDLMDDIRRDLINEKQGEYDAEYYANVKTAEEYNAKIDEDINSKSKVDNQIKNSFSNYHKDMESLNGFRTNVNKSKEDLKNELSKAGITDEIMVNNFIESGNGKMLENIQDESLKQRLMSSQAVYAADRNRLKVSEKKLKDNLATGIKSNTELYKYIDKDSFSELLDDDNSNKDNNKKLLEDIFGKEQFNDYNTSKFSSAEKKNIDDIQRNYVKASEIKVDNSNIENYLNKHQDKKTQLESQVISDTMEADLTKDEVDNYLSNNVDERNAIKTKLTNRKYHETSKETEDTPVVTEEPKVESKTRGSSTKQYIEKLQRRMERRKFVESVYESEGEFISTEQIKNHMATSTNAAKNATALVNRILGGSGNADDITLADISPQKFNSATREKLIARARENNVKLTSEEIAQTDTDAINSYIISKYGDLDNDDTYSRQELIDMYASKLTGMEKFKITSEARNNALVSKYLNENESAKLEVQDEIKEDALTEKKKQMAMGVDGYDSIIADMARGNKKDYQKITAEFKKTHMGMEFSELDITEQNKYLAKKYSNHVSDELVQNKYLENLVKKGVIASYDGNPNNTILNSDGEIDNDAFRVLKNQITSEKGNMSIEAFLTSGKADKFLSNTSKRAYIETLANKDDGSLERKVISSMDNQVFATMQRKITSDKTENLSEVFEAEKKLIIADKVDERMEANKINPITEIPNESKMDERQLREFNITKIMLSNQIRENTNPEILKNILNNSTLSFEDQILRDLAKAQKIDISNYEVDGKINKEGLLNKINPETVNNYFNSNIELKDKMLSIGAGDLTKTLNKNQIEIKNIEALNNNENLRNDVLLNQLNGKYTTVAQKESLILRHMHSSSSLSSAEKNDIERDIRRQLKNEMIKMQRQQNPALYSVSDSDLAKNISDNDIDEFIKNKNVSNDEIFNIALSNVEQAEIRKDVEKNNKGKDAAEINALVNQRLQDTANLRIAESLGIDTSNINIDNKNDANKLASQINTYKSENKLTNGQIANGLQVFNKQRALVNQKLAQENDMYKSVTNNNIYKDNDNIVNNYLISEGEKNIIRTQVNEDSRVTDKDKEYESRLNSLRTEKMAKIVGIDNSRKDKESDKDYNARINLEMAKAMGIKTDRKNGESTKNYNERISNEVNRKFNKDETYTKKAQETANVEIASKLGFFTSKKSLTKEELNNTIVSQARRKEIETQVRKDNYDKSDAEIANLVNEKIETEANEKIASAYGLKSGMSSVNLKTLDKKVLEKANANKDGLMLEIAKEEYLDKDGHIKENKVAEISQVTENLKSDKTIPGFRDSIYKQIRRDISYTSKMTDDQMKQFLETHEITKTEKYTPPKSDKHLHQAVGEFFAKGTQSVLFKVTKKTPKGSVAYNNWNSNIQKQITEVKQGLGAYKDLSADERKGKIEELKDKLIYTGNEKPSNYSSMSTDEKRVFMVNQTKLKTEAMKTKSYSYLTKSQRKVDGTKKAGRKAWTDNYGNQFVFASAGKIKNRKEVHKKNLSVMKAKISEYNAVKSVTDFSDKSKFIAMARQFMGDTKVTDKIIADGASLDAKGRAALLEKAMATRYKSLSRRVAKDNHVSKKTFLEERGIGDTVVRYKDATKKYTSLKSKINTHIPIPGLNAAINGSIYGIRRAIVASYDRQNLKNDGKVNGLTKALYNRVYGRKTEDARVNAQTSKNMIQINMNKLDELNRTFKGTSSEYSAKVKEILGPTFANKVYGKKFKLYNENSAVAIQKRGVYNTLENLMIKEDKRLKYSSNIIPANSDAASKFIGTTLTNSKSARQMKNDKQIADEYNNALNLVKNQKNISSFDAVYRRLLPQISEQFDRRCERLKLLKPTYNFDLKSDDEKFKELEKYLNNKLNKANKTIHNNSMLDTGDKLKKFNGLYLKTDDVKAMKHSKTMQDAIMNSDERYKDILAKYENDNSRYLTEKQNRDNLVADLDKISKMPRNSYTKVEMQRLNSQIYNSNIKLNMLKSALNKSKAMKDTFEQSFADAQIKSAKMKAGKQELGFNSNRMGSIFEDYDIFREEFDEKDGRMKRHKIDPHSVRGKEIALRHKKFINDYEVSMQRIKWILSKHRKIDEEYAKEFEKIYKGKDAKFGDSLNSLRQLINSMDNKIKQLEREDGNNLRYNDTNLRHELDRNTIELKQKLYDETSQSKREFKEDLRTERTKLINMKDQIVNIMNRENLKFETKLDTISNNVETAKSKVQTPLAGGVKQTKVRTSNKSPLNDIDTDEFKNNPHEVINIKNDDIEG